MAVALTGAVLSAWSTGAAAQELRLELTAGAAVGNYTETEAGLDLLPRPTFGALLELWPTETVAAYLGINRSSFGCDEGLCTGQDVSLTSQGVALGGRWSPGLPWVRAGLALQRLDIQGAGVERSEPGLGIELAAGIELPVRERVRIRPALTYLRHAASTERGDGHVSLLALGIGAAVDLGQF